MTTENNDEVRALRIVPPKAAVVAVSILAISGALLLLALFVNTLKESKYIGRDINSQTTITVTGDGDAYEAPNMATVSFSISQDAKNSTDARKTVDEKMQKIHNFLTQSGVAEKDIKNTAYDLYPKYDYLRSATLCIQNLTGGQNYCPPEGKQVLSGYTVTQSVDIKIRKLDDAGKILGGLTDNGASNVSGLTFVVENQDAVISKARKAAITKAEVKASQLASDLGVTLVRIVSFNEGNNYPVYNFAREGMAKAMSADGASTPNIPAGENKYVSNVTIVYEIK